MTWVLLVVPTVSCDRLSWPAAGPPARLVAGRADTVLINSRHAVPLPVRVLDAAGHELAAGVRYVWVSGEPLAVSDSGRVTCTRRLDATVRASLGTLATQFTVLCRPIRRFGVTLDADHGPLVVGGAPMSLAIEAVGLDGAPETQIAGTLAVEDTTVVVARGDRLYPRGPGIASVALDLGDCVLPVGFEVYERVGTPSALRRREQVFMDGPLGLADGERRVWRLPAGEYRVELLPVRGVETGPVLGTTAMNCVGAGQVLHCIALADASVNIRFRRGTSTRRELGGTLVVQRLDVPSYTPAQRQPRQSLPWSKSANPMCRLEDMNRGSRGTPDTEGMEVH